MLSLIRSSSVGYITSCSGTPNKGRSSNLSCQQYNRPYCSLCRPIESSHQICRHCIDREDLQRGVLRIAFECSNRLVTTVRCRTFSCPYGSCVIFVRQIGPLERDYVHIFCAFLLVCESRVMHIGYYPGRAFADLHSRLAACLLEEVRPEMSAYQRCVLPCRFRGV
jgi:hypothetical protein